METRPVSPAFKYVSRTLVGLTILFFLIAVGMTIFIATPNDSQKNAEGWLFTAATSTLSALLGLFAGKVL